MRRIGMLVVCGLGLLGCGGDEGGGTHLTISIRLPRCRVRLGEAL